MTVLAAVRVISFYRHFRETNRTWLLLPFGNFTQLELNVGIWCACMPTCRQLIRRLWVEAITNRLERYFPRRRHSTSKLAAVSSLVKSKGSHRASSAVSEADVTDRKAKKVPQQCAYNGRLEGDEVELIDQYSIEAGLSTRSKFSKPR